MRPLAHALTPPLHLQGYTGLQNKVGGTST